VEEELTDLHCQICAMGGFLYNVVLSGTKFVLGIIGGNMARILIVEDNPIMADAIVDVLEMAGHEIEVAANGEDGLAIIPKFGPELILSDVMMPRMDGFNFYETVRANPAWVFIPFIFLTARGQEEDIYLGKRMGADDYLVKPYSPDNLVATVESKLKRSRAVSQAAGAEMDSMKRTITRVLGHELRTPLTWIQGFAELLLGSADSMSPEELHLSLQSIKSGSDRLARLVEDAVMLTMLDSGQAEEEFRLLAQVADNLSAYIRQSISRVQHYADQRHVTLSYDLPETLPLVLLEPRLFNEALVRILDNGIKFARPGVASYVTVTASANEREVEIVISDNGVGIAADQLGRIFSPLFQADRARHEQQGVGLGLAVAQGLIRLHGGRIWVRSQVDEGTQIYITLPVTQ
jgi:signal transduction histidine kinase